MIIVGTWNASINGNDTAQDLKSEYQAAFFYNDVETALAKIDAYVRNDFNESDEEEWTSYYYSLADFMWKHGILTDEVRNRAVEMIDSGFGLNVWANEGKRVLNQRKKVLVEFREKLLSPQPPKKKISIKLYLNPIFETGDLIAIQLQTENKHYIQNSPFSEEEFRNFNGKYVVLRKVTDKVSYASAIEPRVKDHWAVFQLYGKVFDTCPTPEQLYGIPWADTAKNKHRFHFEQHCEEKNGTFICESSMFFFRKRKYSIIGKDLSNLPTVYNNDIFIFFSVNCAHANTDTVILNKIL